MVQIFQDADGCLFDMNAKSVEIFGYPVKEAMDRYGVKTFWKTARDYREPGTGYGFYRSLPLMPDGQELWDGIRHTDPIILTGCPFGNWAPPQKVECAKAHFGDDVRIITCMARDKIRYLENPGDVLIDDLTKFQDIWEGGGGVFVHHLDAVSTLEKLKELHPELF